jgi:hypothetical protein
MNGAHAELFSFCLYQKVLRALSDQGQLAPLILREYHSVNGTDFEPSIPLAFAQEGYSSSIKVGFKKGSFFISIDSTSLQDRPDIEAILSDSLGFARDDDGRISKPVSRTDIESTILGFAQAVANASQTDY